VDHDLEKRDDRKVVSLPIGTGRDLEDLLRHMRKVREAVPVNTRLREELRQRFLQGELRPFSPEERPSAKKFPWFYFPLLASLVLLVVLGYFRFYPIKAWRLFAGKR